MQHASMLQRKKNKKIIARNGKNIKLVWYFFTLHAMIVSFFCVALQILQELYCMHMKKLH